MSTDLSRGKQRLHLILAFGAVLVMAAAAALASGCHKGDKIAPDGATINMAANPATITKVNGSGSAVIVATVSSAVGVPLEDQDVRFSSTAGSLWECADSPCSLPSSENVANLPVPTDSLGNAYVVLTTTRNTTVTARSGTASGTMTLDAVDGDLSAITLNQEFPSDACLREPTFQSCFDELCLVARAIDPDGAGIPGVLIVFTTNDDFQSSTGETFPGSFTIKAQSTDSAGEVHTAFRLGSAACLVDTGPCRSGETCQGSLKAGTQNEAFVSPDFPFDTNIIN